MNDPTKDQPEDAPLNPALKSTKETVYDTSHRSPPPVDTTSAKEGEGEGWPIVWLVVTVLGLAIAVFLLT
jgi:uncharacterized protein HemX